MVLHDRIRTPRRPGVLPPHPQLPRLHRALDDAAVLALRRGEECLSVCGGEDVVVADVAVLGACEEVCHAEGGGECVGGFGVRDGADGFDGVGARGFGAAADEGASGVRGGGGAGGRGVGGGA